MIHQSNRSLDSETNMIGAETNDNFLKSGNDMTSACKFKDEMVVLPKLKQHKQMDKPWCEHEAHLTKHNTLN